ncbi:MAG TPA: SNF2-related protein, partial [Puia sp.]|nr:SNF2-related protein [Puia sp.]
MALPHLIKYVYTNGTDEVIRRGKKIHAIGYVELIEYDELFETVTFRIKDDSYSTYYKVFVQKFRDAKSLSVRCSCPYNLGDICRHEAAALIQLQELLDRNMLKAEEIHYDQSHTVIKMKSIDLKTLRLLCSREVYEEAGRYLQSKKANILLAADETVKASVEIDGVKYPVVIRKNEERNFDTSSTYTDTDHPLCLPKVILFLQLLQAHGSYYFDSIRNWDKEKNKLLEAYGYSLNDDLKGRFEFSYKDGKPFLRVLDTSIKRVNPAALSKPKPEIESEVAEEVLEPEQKGSSAQRLGVVFNFNHDSYPGFLLDAISGESNEEQTAYVGKIEKLELAKFVNTEKLNEADRQLVFSLRKTQEQEVNKYLNRNSPFSGMWENIIHTEGEELPDDTKALIIEYLHPRYRKLFSELSDNPFIFFLNGHKPFKTSNLQSVNLSSDPVSPSFRVSVNKNNIEIRAYTRITGQSIDLNQNKCSSQVILFINNCLYLWDKPEDIAVISKFTDGRMTISKSEWPAQLRNFVIPLQKEYHVEFENDLIREIKSGDPDRKVLLQEKGDYLLFQPVFSYKGFETTSIGKDQLLVPDGDKVLLIQRNKEKEAAFITQLHSLHSQFIHPQGSSGLALRGNDVLKNNWFFLFMDAMQEMKVTVQGFEALKNFRFNTSRPQTKIHISSSTDWFDARVDIIFGDQKVSIADVKKALANKQQFVPLTDGTLGVLPDEWVKRYALLFRVGEGKSNELRLSRYHLSVIDELYENRNEEELIIHLEKKYEQLKEFKKIKEIDPPAHLLHTLRPYQVHGFHWLNYLHEVNWGGILADDMGLGKTIQALSFLHHYKEHYGHLRALVVCPTTLIFNWENEIKKFAPSLTYRIHHGGERLRNKEALNDFQVIITTYGTLRSDIKLLMDIPLDYVVLDESQAIKNPASKVTKAACLLHAKHRLCMSGTPLQNNTFDIFAQMNFLNPGMLGSIEFFRQEFAIPIDKFGEPDRKDHLRKLLFPFILRRTKEQVAKDLPDKTETILFCEMEDEQRKVYDAYRNDYRDKILGTIESQGIQKSQLTILQGLMKLRQICDSPAILNET